MLPTLRRIGARVPLAPPPSAPRLGAGRRPATAPLPRASWQCPWRQAASQRRYATTPSDTATSKTQVGNKRGRRCKARSAASSPPAAAAAPPPMSEADLEADIAKSAKRVLSHMNDDHADSIHAYAQAYGDGCEAAQSAVISSLTTKGFVLTVVFTMMNFFIQDEEFCIQNDEFFIKDDEFCIQNDEFFIKDDGRWRREGQLYAFFMHFSRILLLKMMIECAMKTGVLIPYTRPLSSAKDLHKIAIEMHISAFSTLGRELDPQIPDVTEAAGEKLSAPSASAGNTEV